MKNKLIFTPVEGNILLEFPKRTNKLNTIKRIQIARDILDKETLEDLATYWVDMYDEMVNNKMEERKNNPSPESPESPESTEPDEPRVA